MAQESGRSARRRRVNIQGEVADATTAVSAERWAEAIAHYVFTHAFVDAMHPTMVVPIVILVVAAAASVSVRGPRREAVAAHEEQAAVA